MESVCCGRQCFRVVGNFRGFNKCSDFKVEFRVMFKIIFFFLSISYIKYFGCINKLFLQISNWILEFFKIVQRLFKLAFLILQLFDIFQKIKLFCIFYVIFVSYVEVRLFFLFYRGKNRFSVYVIYCNLLRYFFRCYGGVFFVQWL